MKSILSKQADLQSRYAELQHYYTIDPNNAEGLPVDTVYDYIQKMQFYMNEEINELLLELGDGDRAVHKPWSTRYQALRSKEFHATDRIRNEAIDTLCFMMNILLVAGIHPENLEAEYDKVYSKNRSRQDDQEY